MATSNFWKTNLPSGVVYFFWSSEDEDTAAYDYNNALEYVSRELDLSECGDTYISNSQILGYTHVKLYDHEYKEWQWHVIDIIVEQWYYNWARFDISLDRLYDDLSSDELNEAQRKIVEKKIAKIEKVFAKVSKKFKKVWSFSSGEGVYSQL